MNHAPQSPLGLRLSNALLSLFNSLGFAKFELDANELIETARGESGLQDFGDNGGFEALEVLCKSLEAEASLTPVGRFLTRHLLLTGLKNQLMLQDWFSRHPEIADEKIEQPIIIIGMPRTGTTILHELMALDPNNRIPLSWELDNPFPPPETQTYRSDKRIAECDKKLKISHYIMPGVENMHRMGAQVPQECVAITSNVFLSMMYNTVYHIPSYAAWLADKADMAPAYKHHRRMHQLLQWRCPGQRWVMKSPGHLWSIEALLQEYPDARLIQTHRDPLKIVSSLGSMLPAIRSAYQSNIDCEALAREWSANDAEALNASRLSRENNAVNSGQIVDIQFGAFMASPEAAVKQIYTKFGLPFTDEFAAAIRTYIAANPADKHGGHKHHFNDTGLDLAEERAKVKAYQDYFGVASEF